MQFLSTFQDFLSKNETRSTAEVLAMLFVFSRKHLFFAQKIQRYNPKYAKNFFRKMRKRKTFMEFLLTFRKNFAD